MRKVQSVVLCEGFQDRAFWAGMLTRDEVGCKSVRERPWDNLEPGRDPWNQPVAGKGIYGYVGPHPSGRFIRLVPRRSEDTLLSMARTLLEQRNVRPFEHLVFCRDWDADARDASVAPPDAGSYLAAFREVAPDARPSDDWTIVLDDGAHIHIAIWRANDTSTVGIPAQQTLERLVCAALAAAYPNRAEAVQEWIDARPDPAGPEHKALAMSYMAGWAADHGSQDFYRHVWDDDAVAAQLQYRLEAIHAWQVLHQLTT